MQQSEDSHSLVKDQGWQLDLHNKKVVLYLPATHLTFSAYVDHPMQKKHIGYAYIKERQSFTAKCHSHWLLAGSFSLCKLYSLHICNCLWPILMYMWDSGPQRSQGNVSTLLKRSWYILDVLSDVKRQCQGNNILKLDSKLSLSFIIIK